MSQQAQAEEPNKERRRDPRRALQTRVALKTDRAIFFLESLDISTTGIRVESEVGLTVGTRCRLIPFFDDVARLFEADGTVVRVQQQTDSDLSHVGIEFDRLNSAELEALLGILRGTDTSAAQRPALVRM